MGLVGPHGAQARSSMRSPRPLKFCRGDGQRNVDGRRNRGLRTSLPVVQPAIGTPGMRSVARRLDRWSIFGDTRARARGHLPPVGRATALGGDRLGNQHVMKDVDPSLEIASLRGEPGGRPQPSRHGADPRG